MKIQLKKSNVLDGSDAREPTPSQMKYGELAVNYNSDDPAIFLKDSDNAIRRIAGQGSVGIPDLDDANQQPGTLDDRYVNLTGDTMTGDLVLPGGGGNTAALQKQEVETLINNSDTGAGKYVERTGDSMSGNLQLPGGGGNNDALQKQEIQTLIDNSDTGAGKYVEVAGDNMTGDLTLGSSNIVLHASNGSAEFTGSTYRFGTFDSTNVTSADSGADIRLGTLSLKRNDADGNPIFKGYSTSGTVISRIYGTGSAEFAGSVSIGGTIPSAPNIELNTNGEITAGTYNGLTVGRGAGNISTNTALGNSALDNNTTGEYNTAVGIGALNDNTEGDRNTAVGVSTLTNNTTGIENTALGNSSLANNTTGEYNTALGRSALYSNITGDSNTAVGYRAGFYIEGENNTILGAYQGSSGDSSLNNTVIISAGTTPRAWCDSTGNWSFGGTLPSAPDIELDANGTITAAGGIFSTNGTQQSYINPNGYAEFNRIGDGANGAVRINSASKGIVIADQNNTANALLNYDGSAEFSSIEVDNLTINVSTISSIGAINLDAALAINFKSGSTNNDYRFYNTAETFYGTLRFNTLAANRFFNFPDNGGTVALTSDSAWVTGSTSTAGILTLASNLTATFNGDVEIGSDVTIKSSNGNITINGNYQAGGNPASGTADGCRMDSTGTVRAAKTTGNNAIWTGYQVGSALATSRINADGSASYSGTVTATVVPPSDARFKTNITPAKPQLADIVALGGLLKNYNWNDLAPVNDELRSQRQLGLIAQEVAEVCPSITKTIHRTRTVETKPAVTDDEGAVVTEAVTKDVDESYKGISQDALIMKLLGAVAELSAEVEALKSA